jgi:hypothetical protein
VCLTLPLWREILDDFCAVFVLRDAMPVARSLRRRERFPVFYSYALWDDYNRRAVAAMAGLPVVRVDFEAMVRDPLGETSLLHDELSSLGIDLNGEVEAAAASIHAPTGAPGPDRSGLGRRLAAALRSGPSVSACFRPPSLPGQPAWVGPTLRLRRSWLTTRQSWADGRHPR